MQPCLQVERLRRSDPLHPLRSKSELAVSRAKTPEHGSEIGAFAMFLLFVLGVVAVVAFGFF